MDYANTALLGLIQRTQARLGFPADFDLERAYMSVLGLFAVAEQFGIDAAIKVAGLKSDVNPRPLVAALPAGECPEHP
jgi:hypothetical protein